MTLREARGDSGDCCLPQINWQSADREQNLENAIVAEFTDEMNGKRSDREGFQQMFAAASRREFDCVLFWLLDRFSREGVYETLQHLQRLTSYGVRHRSFTEQYLDSHGLFRDAVVSILATIAKQERIRLSERTIAGLERARSQGRVGGRPGSSATERRCFHFIGKVVLSGRSRDRCIYRKRLYPESWRVRNV